MKACDTLLFAQHPHHLVDAWGGVGAREGGAERLSELVQVVE